MELGGLEPPISWVRSDRVNVPVLQGDFRMNARPGVPEIVRNLRELARVLARGGGRVAKPLTATETRRAGGIGGSRFLAGDNGDPLFRFGQGTAAVPKRDLGYRNSSIPGSGLRVRFRDRTSIHLAVVRDGVERRPGREHKPCPSISGVGDGRRDRTERHAAPYAFEKSAVFGICEGGVPTTIAISLRSVSSIARGSC
jgi:hypothetical protein